MPFGVKENTRQAAIQAVYSTAHGLASDWGATGMKVYAPMLEKPSDIARGLHVDTVAVQIQGIEAAGWVLQTFAVDGGRVTCLFRQVHE